MLVAQHLRLAMLLRRYLAVASATHQKGRPAFDSLSRVMCDAVTAVPEALEASGQAWKD